MISNTHPQIEPRQIARRRNACQRLRAVSTTSRQYTDVPHAGAPMTREFKKTRHFWRKNARGYFGTVMVLLACLPAASALPPTTAVGQDYGRIGTPAKITVGYQPYYAEAWSAAVIRGAHLEKQYLPVGSSVNFYIASRGLVLVHALEAGEIQIAYLGDVPAVLAATSTDAAIVAVPATSENQCSVLLVRPGAPTQRAALVRWLNGKRMAVPRNSCSESFLDHLLRTYHIRPAAVYNQDPDTIATAFRAGLLDAAVVWQPAATRIQSTGLAHAALTGADLHWRDGAFLLIRNDLIRTRPDIVEDWLKAERAAENYLADPANGPVVVKMLTAQTMTYTAADLRQALASLSGKHGLHADFTFTPQARAVLQRARDFLVRRHRLDAHARPAVQGRFAAAILRQPVSAAAQ